MSEVPMQKTGMSQNLKKGFATPTAKVVLGIFALSIVGFGVLGWKKITSGPASTSGRADAAGFDVRGAKPRGATDSETAAAVGASADKTAEAAAASGSSYAGPFVFDADSGGNALGAGPNNPTTRQAAQEILTALRKRASEYDASEEAAARDARAGQGGNRNAQNDTNASNRQNAGDYGLGPEGFKQITAQLDRVGRPSWSYGSLPGGVLSQQSAPPSAPSPLTPVSTSTASTASTPGGSAKANAEYIAARAGSTCAALPDSGYDTDIALPVFATLQNCGDLTSARVKGNIQKSADNFTVRFNALFLDPAKRLKITSAFDASAVSIEKDGDPRIADNVNNHWWTRIGSSALLSLARTEQSFISSRGTTSTSTGFSTSTAVEGLTDKQKNDARAAGVLQGAMEVVTRDVGVGVNRQPTMTTNKSTLIGVQFLDDVKVVRLE